MKWITSNRFPGIVLLATALLLPACGWPQSQSAATSGQGGSAATADTDVHHLHGVVVDSRTGRPIARALVQGFGDRLATLTDGDGRFALNVRYTDQPGSDNPMRRAQAAQTMFLFLSARKPGYVITPPLNQQIAVSSLDQDIQLKLTPMAVIQGRVAASGEDHPENVRLSLFFRRIQNGAGQWGQISNVATDSRGEFRFGNLEPGEYKIATAVWSDQPQTAPTADKPASRYAPVYYPVDSAAASGPGLHVSAGESVQANLNLHAELFYPVRIPIAFPGETNPGVQVRLLRGNVPTSFNLNYSGRDHAVEGLLPNGVYEAILESFGQEAYSAEAALTVAGAPVTTGPITMLPNPSIPVIVHQDLTQTQGPAAQSAGSRGLAARIRNGLTPGGASPLQMLLIPEEGNRGTFSLNQNVSSAGSPSDALRVANVSPGTYRLELWSNQGYVAAATSGGTDLLRQPLIVSAGAGVQPIEVTIRDDVATVLGTVSPDALSGTMSPLFIFCLPSPPSAQRLQPTWASNGINAGQFTLSNIPPGSYRIFAARKPMESFEYRSEAWMKRNASKGYPITLEPGATASVTLTSVLEEEP